MSQTNNANSESTGSSKSKRRPLQRWKKALLAVSLVLMLLGGALTGYSAITRPADVPAAQTTSSSGTNLPAGARGFLPGTSGPLTRSDPAPAEQPPQGLDAYAPTVFRLGFSFFVGFCIAYALRTFFRISAIAIGLMLLALFGLQYAGLIDVNWSAMEQHFDSLRGWLETQTRSMQQFITGQLPSAASAIAGLAVGFKK